MVNCKAGTPIKCMGDEFNCRKVMVSSFIFLSCFYQRFSHIHCYRFFHLYDHSLVSSDSLLTHSLYLSLSLPLLSCSNFSCLYCLWLLCHLICKCTLCLCPELNVSSEFKVCKQHVFVYLMAFAEGGYHLRPKPQFLFV